MEQRMQALVQSIENYKTGCKDKLYLGSCLKKLKVYALTDSQKFTTLVTQMATVYNSDVDNFVHTQIIKFLAPEVSNVEKDSMTQMMQEHKYIVRVVSEYLNRHQVDETLGEVVVDALLQASKRQGTEKKDMTVVVSALLYSMQNMCIPGGDPQSLINQLLTLLVDTNNKVCLISVEMVLVRK